MAYSVRAEGFDGIGGAWEEMLPLCEANTIFLTPWWQQTWWRHFGDGVDLCLLSVRDGDDVIGIAPMMRRAGVLSLLGDTDLFDYHDFVVPRGNEAEFYHALCEHLDAAEWQTLKLAALRHDSPTLRYLPALAESKGFSCKVDEVAMCPATPLPATWDDYLAGLSKKDRHELRRKMRRLDRANHANQYVCETTNGVSPSMSDFFRLHRASSPDKDAFWTPRREGFFLDLASELARRGQFKLYFLEIDGVKVASCICFDYDGAYLLYNSGYDPEFSSLSVGLVNKALCIKDAIDKGRRSFDFLKGTERYKYDLGGKNQAICALTISR